MKKKAKKHQEQNDLSGLIHFISSKFDGVETRFDALEGMFRNLQGAVDAYAKRADAYFQEMVMLSH